MLTPPTKKIPPPKNICPPAGWVGPLQGCVTVTRLHDYKKLPTGYKATRIQGYRSTMQQCYKATRPYIYNAACLSCHTWGANIPPNRGMSSARTRKKGTKCHVFLVLNDIILTHLKEMLDTNLILKQFKCQNIPKSTKIVK